MVMVTNYLMYSMVMGTTYLMYSMVMVHHLPDVLDGDGHHLAPSLALLVPGPAGSVVKEDVIVRPTQHRPLPE